MKKKKASGAISVIPCARLLRHIELNSGGIVTNSEALLSGLTLDRGSTRNKTYTDCISRI